MTRITYVLALIWTVGVTLYLAFVPIYGERKSWIETRPSGETFRVTEPGTQTLVDVNGRSALLMLAIPLALVILPLAIRPSHRQRPAGITAGILLLALSFLGGASIGMYYYPSAIALLLAGAGQKRVST
jgi:hypothetical protein